MGIRVGQARTQGREGQGRPWWGGVAGQGTVMESHCRAAWTGTRVGRARGAGVWA